MAESPKMWKHLGEGLAAVGVIASLAFVALEVRQNTEAVRASTIQAISQQSMETIGYGLGNPDLITAVRIAADSAGSLSVEQRGLVRWFYTGILRVTENRYRQIVLGVLTPEAAFQLGGGSQVYATVDFAEWWDGTASGYAPDFRSFMDDTFLPAVRAMNNGNQ